MMGEVARADSSDCGVSLGGGCLDSQGWEIPGSNRTGRLGYHSALLNWSSRCDPSPSRGWGTIHQEVFTLELLVTVTEARVSHEAECGPTVSLLLTVQVSSNCIVVKTRGRIGWTQLLDSAGPSWPRRLAAPRADAPPTWLFPFVMV